MIKLCTDCNQEKPATKVFWYKNTGGKLGFRSTCKICTNKDNIARHKKSSKKWELAKRNGVLKRNYGITLEQYNKMLMEQESSCLICHTKSSGRKNSKRLCVDHSHKTGKVKGLLCSICNSIIGFIERTNNPLLTVENIVKYRDKLDEKS